MVPADVVTWLFTVLPDRWVYGVEAGPRRRPPAEVALGCFNFAGFLCLVFALYQVGRRWFEVSIGVMAVVVFAGSKLNWDFAFSGLPTVWLGLLCLAVAAVAMRIGGAADPDAEGRPRIVTFRYGVWSAVLGGLLGVGFLVSYSFGFLVLPVAICVGWWAPSEARVRTVGCLLLAFLLLATPWMARNYLRSGLPLGIATLAPLAGTPAFTEDQLERSQNPDLSRVRLAEVLAKVLSNSHHILSNDVPRMFGNWFGAFLLVGLLLPMGDARMNRFRWLLLSMLLALVPAQALIQTHLATLSPYLNSENLLAWFVPLAGLYAAVVFRWALDSFDFPFPLARWMALVVPMGLYMFCFALSGPQAIAGALTPFPRAAGAASSLMGFFQSLSTAAVGMGVAICYDGTPRALAGFVCLMGVLTFVAHRAFVSRLPADDRQAHHR